MSSKLILGTVQFGLDYGINNKKGKMSHEEVFKILSYASANGIDTLDTAYSYGDSEEKIGAFIKNNNIDFKIISKVPACQPEEVKRFLERELTRLNKDKIYGYLIHDFDNFRDNTGLWSELEKFKKDGRVEKLGFSLYSPQELDYLLSAKFKIDIVHVPYSIFDQRFHDYFSILKKNNIEIHVRSLFLQGLVFKPIEELHPRFQQLKDKLEILQNISRELKISISALCINFANLNYLIEKIIVGVDNLENLAENIKTLDYCKQVEKVYDTLRGLKEDSVDLVSTKSWAPKMFR